VNKFRKLASYLVMGTLMTMLIISFALWGIGDMLKVGGRSTEVAHVGGTHIPLYGWLGGTSVSVEEVLEASLSRIEALNPSLNAVITPMFDQAREQARSASTGWLAWSRSRPCPATSRSTAPPRWT